MNYRGVGRFLLAVFALGFAGQIIGLQTGLLTLEDATFLNTVVLIAVLCIPALAAYVARTMAPDRVADDGTLWPIPFGAALKLTLLVHLVVFLSYLIPSFAGWADVQWQMGELGRAIDEFGLAFERNEQTAVALPILALSAGVIFSVVLGATVYALVALGTEAGWRGYLLPRLLTHIPAWPAYIVIGMLWSLWFLPLILTFHLRYYDLSQFVRTQFFLAIFAIVMAAFLGEIWRRTRHLGLCAIALGAFAVNAQQGIFGFLFIPSIEGRLYTGPFGLVALILFALATLALRFLLPSTVPAPADETATPSLNPSPGL